MKTPEEIKNDLAAWGTGVRIDIGCGEFVPPTPEYMLNGVRSADVCRDALAYIQQLEAQVPKWISVEDRLPSEPLSVAVYIDEGEGSYWIQTAYMNGGKWRIPGEFVVDRNITHWMPLPEPPEEG